jgi:S-methylmethionine-dependent homocysteine/selenocysteine methylase
VLGSKTKGEIPVVTLLDGGMGFELQLRGTKVPSHTESIWSALALIEDPDAVVDVHVAYIEAGADVLTINNYAVTPPILAREGMEHRVEELTELAVDLAEKACARAGRRPRLAGSFPPLETSYRADLVKGREDVLEGYRRIASVLTRHVDLILCETLASSREAVWACEAASETGCEYWMSWTLQGTRLNTLPSGESLADAYSALGGVTPTPNTLCPMTVGPALTVIPSRHRGVRQRFSDPTPTPRRFSDGWRRGRA